MSIDIVPPPVTDGETALSTAHPAPEPQEATNSAARARARARVAAEPALTQGDSAAAFPVRSASFVERIERYWTPPEPTSRPATVPEVVRYARYGEWTQETGPLRVIGIGYSWLAVAITTGLYYAAWIVQRPGRLVTFLFLYALLAQTPIGAWLPWPGWL